MSPGLEGLRAYYIFADEMGEVRGGNIHFLKEDRRSHTKSGMPLEEDLLAGRHQGYRYCNFLWLTPGYTLVAVDYLDLNKYFWSK